MGAYVILACRDMKKCDLAAQYIKENTGSKNVECMELDLSSLSSIRSFAKNFTSKDIPLHLLINNAGVMIPPLSRTKEGFELQFGVNHVGHFMLTRLLLNKLKDGSPSRIVNVSSLAHKRGNDAINTYDELALLSYIHSYITSILLHRKAYVFICSVVKKQVGLLLKI
eukprot:TRINITY_DN4204_c0_g1_i7.p1 TRINITY_DN4204_c0_g1~~TRINITY_DN4204_c0_g1_i7.p1  ORF type:complete len:168 (-),score=19.23 TRINITY_DN4204_c0_g1_i7:342-845(-)